MIPDIVSQSLISDGLALYLYLSLVSQDHEVQTKLKETRDIQSFAQVAVQLAEERGYHFDSQEVEALLNNEKVNAEKVKAESIKISDNLLLADVDYYTSNLPDPACQNTATGACQDYLKRFRIDPYSSNLPHPACQNTATDACKWYAYRVTHPTPPPRTYDDCVRDCSHMPGGTVGAAPNGCDQACYIMYK